MKGNSMPVVEEKMREYGTYCHSEGKPIWFQTSRLLELHFQRQIQD